MFFPADRRYALKNLKRNFESIAFIKHGRDSGYPPCCIAYYWIRSVLMNIHAIIFGNYGFFYTMKDGAPRWRPVNGPRHVLCWFHKVVYRNKPMVYHMCEPCNWLQFQQPKCNKCGVTHE